MAVKNNDASRVLITGAASGLGKALANAFGRRGWKIALCDIDDEAMATTAEDMRSQGYNVMTMRCDVRNESDLKDARRHCEREWGGLDVLINNAGIASIGAIDNEPLTRWQRMIDINVLGVVRGCETFVPLFKQQGGGHIVNIASIAGLANTPFMSAYNATKAAVISLSETLLVELKPKRIGVTVVCPAMFKTGIAERADIDHPKLRQVLESEMEKSSISADDIAEQVFKAVQGNRFMLMPHRPSRWQWRIKRVSSRLYRWCFLSH